MKQNKNKSPMQETTKDDSSDVKRVQQETKNTTPQPPPANKESFREDEQAQKGHA